MRRNMEKKKHGLLETGDQTQEKSKANSQDEGKKNRRITTYTKHRRQAAQIGKRASSDIPVEAVTTNGPFCFVES